MKYLAPISILIGLVSATPLATTTGVTNMMSLHDMAETYAPCMKTCGITAHSCTMQPGTVAATCTHDFATCMLRCESMIMPEPVKCVSDCTMVAVDEMTSGMDMDMMMLHLKDCVKNH